MITPEQEVELQEIAARMVAGTASPEEQATLLKLSDLKKRAVAERADKIEKFVLAIKQHAVHFNELAGAFDKEQIAAWAQANGLMKPDAPRKSRTTNKGPALIKFKMVTGGKFPAAYRLNQQGQLNEKFVTLYRENPDNYEKALRGYFTEEGKNYFATDEGEEHLAKLINKIKARAEKGSSPAAKKSTAAKKTPAAKKSSGK